MCAKQKCCAHGTFPASPPPFSASQFRVWIPCPRPRIAFFPRVNSADFRRGGVGGGLGSHLAGFSPNTEIRFFDDFSIFTWLLPCFLADIFSSWNCGFFDVMPPGDGYSLLCSKKQLPRHNKKLVKNSRFRFDCLDEVKLPVAEDQHPHRVKIGRLHKEFTLG